MRLSKAVAIYVEVKRAQGLHYGQAAAILDRFVRCVGDKHLTRIKKVHVRAFVSNGNTANDNTWIARYRLVRAFLEYWRLRGQIKALPLPPRRRETPRTFLPYIYTRAELGRMLKAAAVVPGRKRPTAVDPFTFRTLLMFLYGTGVLINEALGLLCSDVDLKEDLLILRRFGKSRRIPIGRDVHVILRDYLRSPVRKQHHNAVLFLNMGGRPIGYMAIYKPFRRLCQYEGIARRDAGRYQPRIRDLRFTFAVHRLTSWYKQGVNIERMLLQLSDYLGETDSSMEKYLAMTPERFSKQLHELKLNVFRSQI